MKVFWGCALVLGIGCSDGTTGLGTASTRDAGREAATAPATATMCGATGVRPGVHFEADASARVTVRSGPPVTQRTGQALRAGSAFAMGTDVLWAVADDRCGRSARGMWWGAVVGRLAFDPDQNVTSTWSCFADTWAALHVTPVPLGDSLGVFFVRHVALDRVANQWVPLGAASGAAEMSRRRFETTWDVNDVALATIAPDAEGYGVLFTRGGGRFYQRLDRGLQAAGEEVSLGREQRPGGDLPSFLQPHGESLRSLWGVVSGSLLDVEVTTYGREGQALGAWTMGARVGTRRHLRALDAVPVEGGFVAVVATGDGDERETWLARFCDDGVWSMRRFTRDAYEASLLRHGGRWVVVSTRPFDGSSEQRVEAHVLDDDGRRMAPAHEIDTGRVGNGGDLVAAPGTHDLVALYVLSPSGENTQQARAARLTLTP